MAELTQSQRRAVILAQARKRKQEQEQEQALQDKYQKEGEAAEDLSVRPESFEEVDPFAMSEAGLDVGTPESAKGTARSVAQGATFGFGDEIEAGLRYLFGGEEYGEELEEVRSEMAEFEEQKPEAAMVGETVGALMSPAGVVKAPAAIARMGGMKRGTVLGGTGAATYGFGSGEGFEDRVGTAVTDASVGILFSAPVEKFFGRVDPDLERLSKSQRRNPTIGKLEVLRDEAYKLVDNDQVAMPKGSMNSVVESAEELFESGLGREKAQEAISTLKRRMDKQLTIQDVTKLRNTLFDIMQETSAVGERKLIRDMIGELDKNAYANMSEESANALLAARTANNNYEKARTLQSAFDRAKQEKNKTVAYQKAADNLLNSPKMRYFNELEQEVIRQFADGSVPKEIKRLAGRLAPSASGFNTLIYAASSHGNPLIPLLSIATQGTKLVTDRNVIRRAQELVEKMGGIDAVENASRIPPSATFSLGGVTADQVRQAVFGSDTEDREEQSPLDRQTQEALPSE